MEKDKQMSDLQAEVAELREAVELHKKKNNVRFNAPSVSPEGASGRFVVPQEV